MREKLLNLMRSEGLTSSRLAELLGIQPSGISHILSGRNKPSFDFVQKILRRFPAVSPDWLLLDQGPMYREKSDTAATASEPAVSSRPAPLLFADTSVAEHSTEATPPAAAKPYGMGSGNDIAAATADNIAHRGNVKRIIVLFDDHTFESYNPSR